MIKKILKHMRNLLLVTLGVGSLYLINLFFMKPFSIDHFLAKELILDLTSSPEELTYVGVLDDYNWLTNHNSKLSIPKETDIEDGIEHTEKAIKTLYKYDDSRLSDTQISTKKIAIFDYENHLRELRDFPYLDYPLNQIGGIHLNTIEFMNDVHPVSYTHLTLPTKA